MPLRVKFIDQKGFHRIEWLTEALPGTIWRRFPLAPLPGETLDDPPAEPLSVRMAFERIGQEGDMLIYREVSPSPPAAPVPEVHDG